jgi:division protein CdvB (Snf7/Vps24/ESCRT-III family)
MPSPTKPGPAKSARDTAPIADALDKNKQVAEEVKDVADELAVVHAVLDKKLPRDANATDVAQAVARADHLEKRLTASGAVLDEVNESLQRAVEERGGSPR